MWLACKPRNIEKVGELLYCYNRGRTSCCFVNEQCGGNWVAINDGMVKKAVGFMQAPGVFLRNLVEEAGYDSCHRTEAYDAQPCYEDCQRQEISQFAEKCRQDGGLYKCCIRYCLLFLSAIIQASVHGGLDKSHSKTFSNRYFLPSTT